MLKPIESILISHIKGQTKIDGDRCPLYPSCSAWALHAIREHGYAGFLMTIDRMIYRESGNLYEKYLKTPLKLSKNRFYDPVEDSLPIFKTHHPSFLKEDFPELNYYEKELSKFKN